MERPKRLSKLASVAAGVAVGFSAILPQERQVEAPIPPPESSEIDLKPDIETYILSVNDVVTLKGYGINNLQGITPSDALELLSMRLAIPEHRTDCENIRGTDYESSEERIFFLDNCVEEKLTRQNSPGSFFATHYGESYNGHPLGCGTGNYSSDNMEILAVAEERYNEWPCGTKLRITNPANGAVLDVVRHDACPGCEPNTLDLSEKGLDHLCGKPNCSSVSGLIVEKID